MKPVTMANRRPFEGGHESGSGDDEGKRPDRKNNEFAGNGQQWHRFILESVEDFAIITLDLNRRITSWNTGAHNLCQFTAEEIMGEEGDIIFTPEDRLAKAPERETKLAKQHGRARNERWHMRKDGSRFWGSGLTYALRADNNDVLGYVKIMRDLTDQRLADEIRRANETRQSYLIRLEDALRPLSSLAAIQEAATRTLGEQLNVEKCFYAELDAGGEGLLVSRGYRKNNASASERYHTGDFGPFIYNEYKAHRTVVVGNVLTDPRITDADRGFYKPMEIVACISVPFIRNDQLVSVLMANQSSPRDWLPQEIVLVEETAQRTWAAIERARAEGALALSEEQFRVFLTATSDALYRMSVDWKEIRWLKGIDFLAATKEADTNWFEKYILESDRFLARAAIEKAIREKRAFELEHRILRTDGTVGWTFTRAIPFFDEKGEISEWLGAATDITARKKAEEALRESEEQFRILANTVPQVIWTNDEKGRAIYFNRRWFEYSGLNQEISSGAGWQQIVHPDDAAASERRWERALERGEVFENEYRLRGADGTYRWFIARNVPLHDDAGRVKGWFGTATDIHHLKAVEQALRQTTERLRVTMESALDYAIITLDTEGKIQGWSRGAELSFGYKEADIIGQYAGVLFVPDDREAHVPEKEIEAAALDGIAIDERWHMRRDGSRFYMSGIMRPIYNRPELSGFVKVARDMTEQKLIDQQKDEFIGIASHELKTPVTSIKAYIELLRETLVALNSPESESIINKVRNQVDRLIGLIQTLLETTKISEGRLLLRTETVNLNELIQEHLEEFQRLTTKHLIILEPGDIPDVSADRERILQVLSNLIANAIKYSPSGGDIFITTSTENGNVKVAVRDFGIGMTADARQKVFERFYRVGDPRIQTFPGMGLGLYIASGIVKRHHGTIWAESALNKGSVFYFTLPVDVK